MKRITALFIVAAAAGPLFAWWDVWPYLEHQALMSRSIDIAAERYQDMAVEITAYRDELLSGAHDEDFDSDGSNGSYCDYSGFCAVIPDAWWPTAARPLNAIQWIHDSGNPNCWDSAVAAYARNRADAYHRLGHIEHNLQDLFIPAHSHISPHGSGTGNLVENHSWPTYPDNFEQWCEVNDHELKLARADRIPVGGRETLMKAAAVFSSTDNESAAFYPSQYYAMPDAPGGWGRYRPYPSGGHPCGYDNVDNDCANSWSEYLVPRCCEVAAAAIRTFYLAGNLPNSQGLRVESPVKVGSPFRIIGLDAPATIALVDITGRVVARLSISPSESVLCPSIPAGPYGCQVSVGGATFTQPIVVVPRPR